MTVELHLGDCLDVMRGMADKSVDAVITDPPYTDQTHDGARTGDNGEIKLIDFESITEAQFLAICRESVRVARRWVVMTCDWQHAAIAKESGLPVVRLGIWIKPNGAPQFTGDRPGMGWEAVLIMHREGKKRWNGGGSHAVWIVPKVEGEYPTVKPLKLIKKWINLFTDPGETILDPCMGSGTTALGCIALGRNFIGIDKNPAAYNIAERRIHDAQQQMPLFVAP